MTQTADPALLFARRCTVQVGSLLIQTGEATGLDVNFTVRRGVKVTASGTKPQPNTCDLALKNLSPDHRKAIEASTVPGAAATTVPVNLSAGYRGRQTVIFSGELRAAQSLTDGPTIVTELTTGDGDQALTQRRLTLALGPGANPRQAAKAILAGLGIGAGNLDAGLALLSQTPLSAQLFAKGVVFKGSAAEIMTEFCRSVGLDWSIQNGRLQLTQLGQPAAGQAVLLDADHGLIGSPTVDTKGILTCQTEMIPDVFPGTKLSLQAKTVKGGFRVLHVETKGATDGNDWGHTIEATRY